MAKDNELNCLCQFLEDEFQDAQYRHNLAYFDGGNDYTKNETHHKRDAMSSVIFMGYIEVWGLKGEKKARTILDERKEAAWEQFMNRMIDKYNLPSATWKALYKKMYNPYDEQLVTKFWDMFEEYKAASEIESETTDGN